MYHEARELLSVSTFCPIKEHSGTQQGVAAADDAPLETWNARSIHWLFEETEACSELSYLWKLVQKDEILEGTHDKKGHSEALLEILNGF